MTEALYIVIAFGVGFGSAFQIGMLGLLHRDRGAFEASWINMLSSGGLLLAAMLVVAVTKQKPDLPSPLNQPYVYGILLALSAIALAYSMKGLDQGLASVGLFGFAYVLAAAYLAPQIGVALYIAAVTAGTLFGGVGVDHFGWFGGSVIRIDALKVIGLVFLMAGVVLIRGR